MGRRLDRRHRERGAAAVEFALVVPLLLVLTFGMIDYGLFFADTLAARDGAAAAARQGAVENYGAGNCSGYSATGSSAELRKLACFAVGQTASMGGSAYARVANTTEWKVGGEIVVCVAIVEKGLTGLTPMPNGSKVLAETHMRIEQAGPVFRQGAGLRPSMAVVVSDDPRGALDVMVPVTGGDDRGAVAVMVAALATVLFGFGAIVVDLGAARTTSTEAQNAADASVLAASNVLYAANPATPDFAAAVQAAKDYAASNYGTVSTEWAGCIDPGRLAYKYTPGGTECITFDDQVDPATVRVRIPPRRVGSFFGGVVGYDGMTVSTIAEASKKPVPGECVVCVFGELSVEQAGRLNVSGGGSVHAGTILVPNPGPMGTPGKVTVLDGGEIAASAADPASDNTRYDPNPPRTDLDSVEDPLSVTPPADASVPVVGTCDNTHPLTPGSYTDINVPAGHTCTFQPGLYRISGKVDFPGGADLVGGNVTLYFVCTGASPGPTGCGGSRLEGDGSVTISGWDNTGGWNTERVSILFANTLTGHQHIGNSPGTIAGAVYAPAAHWDVQNGQDVVARRIIVSRLELAPNSDVSVNVSLGTLDPAEFGLSK